ncbi:MAG: MBL fold metallo-hydrolase [Melioribacteraceae bacterium]|nr:MBL fold metallo-hydrolase [Melioribacteraceae bacterium]
MKLNRRTFLKTSSLVTAGLLLPSNQLLNALQQDTNGSMNLLRNNIGTFTEKGGTIGWLISDDAVIVIDSQFPDSAKHFITKMMEKTDRNIDYLINTHHHSDHTAGNFMMNKLTDKIVAQENAVELQKQFYGKGENASSQVYANITFSDKWKTDLGNESISLFHHWNAHTGGDAVIHFENANIAHLGDLVFNGVYPYMDRPGGTNLEGWIKFLDELISFFDNDTLFIFGHGTKITGTKNDIITKRNYLSALNEYVKDQIVAGKAEEEILNSKPLPGFDDLTPMWKNAFKMNLKAAYDELTL